ncbi:Fumarate hydratase [Fasciola gigantica]|uniref:Fumarate hydratase n=1 Tax=Fasciola gigantica TaxID=46835 RepID=A0A504YCP3_FASGI|nr:Fumarate hydratase [Fasciola gigantica]
MPRYFCDHPVYYAGPAKTPDGLVSGSFGPTTAGRMDSYVDLFQSHGGSKIMLAKGNRSRQNLENGSVRRRYLSFDSDTHSVVDKRLRGSEGCMEAIWRVEVADFPAFIVVDDKGNDFFEKWQVD